MPVKKYYPYPHPELIARAKELRRPLTPAEAKLWHKLKTKQFYGLKFRRQHPIHRFILDFYCHEQRLVIEVDGDSHAEPAQQSYDQARTEWLNQQGLRVLRFSNREIEDNLEGVLVEIARQCGVWPPSGSPLWGESR
jgi:very-short-patch-repair endonuclease